MIEIEKVVAEYSTLKKRGDNYFCLCPLKKETVESFSINPREQLWYCFSCGIGGDVIKFIQHIEKLSYQEAILYLNNKYKLNLNIKDSKSEYYSLVKDISKLYFKALKSNKSAQEFLKLRNISDETIDTFKLGFATSICKYAEYTNSTSKLKELYLIKNDRDFFYNRIMFPIATPDNMHIIGFSGRIINDSQPKYLHNSNNIIFQKDKVLYGLNLTKEYITDTVILVEGPIDLISLWQEGIRNVVASLGISLSEYQAKEIRKYAENVIIFYDSDEAGSNAALRIAPVLLSNNLNVSICKLKDCKDPDEYIKKYPGEISKIINNPIPLLDFIYSSIENFSTISKKSEFISYIIGIIDHITNPVVRNLIVKDFANRGINILLLSKQKKVYKKEITEEETLIKIYIRMPEVRKYINEYYSTLSTNSQSIIDIVKRLEDINSEVTLQTILNFCETEELKKYVLNIAFTEKQVSKKIRNIFDTRTNFNNILKGLKFKEIENNIMVCKQKICFGEDVSKELINLIKQKESIRKEIV